MTTPRLNDNSRIRIPETGIERVEVPAHQDHILFGMTEHKEVLDNAFKLGHDNFIRLCALTGDVEGSYKKCFPKTPESELESNAAVLFAQYSPVIYKVRRERVEGGLLPEPDRVLEWCQKESMIISCDPSASHKDRLNALKQVAEFEVVIRKTKPPEPKKEKRLTLENIQEMSEADRADALNRKLQERITK